MQSLAVSLVAAAVTSATGAMGAGAFWTVGAPRGREVRDAGALADK